MPSYELPETASLEMMIEHCTSVIAGLEAVDELAPLAAPWVERRARLRHARDERDADRDAVTAASAKVRVADARWDGSVVGLSGIAFLAAGKDAKASPYAPLFGAVRAVDAVKLGAAKEAAFGAQLAKRARELNHPQLAGALAELEARNASLAMAAAARAEATSAVQLHAIKRGKLVDDLNALVAVTEVGILTAFPGRKELTRAVLARQVEKRSSAAEAEDAAVETAQ